ncbi:HEPN domain-containing protein [Nostoc sp. FACHB-973]|nr:HEPN domain-containing protein [Nostoc sp. FACHB-973]
MTSEHYLEQARSNEEAARSIEKFYPDWAITMCFYAALHWVKYYACQRGDDLESLESHDAHRGYLYDLADERRERELHKLYDHLHGASEKARYFKSTSHRRHAQPIRDDSAINYFRTHQQEVNTAFQKLQQIKDILQIS